MASITPLRAEQDFNNPRYMKCLIEGVRDWIETKAQTGNIEIARYRDDLEKEIKSPINSVNSIFKKMISLRIEKDTLEEFKQIFILHR